MTLVETPSPAPAGANGGALAPPPNGAAIAATLSTYDRSRRRVLSIDELAALVAEARRLVEGTTLPQKEIARRIDVRPSTLSLWKSRGRWTRPLGAPTAPDFSGPAIDPAEKAEARRRRMVGRLYRVFDRQTADLEARAKTPGATTEEKDARTLATLWALIEPASAGEKIVAGHLSGVVTHLVTLRFRDDIAGGMRVAYRGRTFRVLAVSDPDETRRFLVAKCEEETR